MTNFYLAISVFLLAHIIPAYKPLRNGLADLMGERPFLVAYGTLSTVLMIWLFWAYFDAPYVELWAFEEWMRWVPLIIMPISCILITTGLGSPNPLSISFISVEKFDEQHPGIVALSSHPAIWGLFLWSASHVIPNGDLAAVLMFSLLSLLGLYGPVSLNMKRKHRLGNDEWQRINVVVKQAPISVKDIGFGKIVLGLVVYGILLYFHGAVIGVEPVIL
ncbi:MAG: NnrU family protein [Alphaproteobacteria bacterium]|nr:NnrU family protein [Rhodospirillales bacterium]MCW9046195.1 NnrU family protein [Alphaproteobacteria bacterium]